MSADFTRIQSQNPNPKIRLARNKNSIPNAGFALGQSRIGIDRYGCLEDYPQSRLCSDFINLIVTFRVTFPDQD